MQLPRQPQQAKDKQVNILTQLAHKLTNHTNTQTPTEHWETTPQSAYPITMRTGTTTITNENEETTTYHQTTTIIQEHPEGGCYTATLIHNGEIIGWHLNPIAITTQ